jgi:starvation-inducible DNA-binding protein
VVEYLRVFRHVGFFCDVQRFTDAIATSTAKGNPPMSTITRTAAEHLSEPIVPATRGATQAFSTARKNPLALDATAAAASIDNLNQLLADTLTLRDLYKKHHWQVSGPSFYVMHLLFDKHFEEQSKLVDLLAERVQTLGGVSIAMAPDVAEATLIPRAPKDREDTATQIARLLQAHEVILLEARAMARDSSASGDLGTNDIIVSNVIRTNELQVWFLAEHLQ